MYKYVLKTAYADSGHHQRDVHCVFILNLSPGDPAIILGDRHPSRGTGHERKELGLDDPLVVTDIT